MFGNRDYIEQHQDSVMAIIRSVGVCLHILLEANNNPNVSEFLDQALFNENENDTHEVIQPVSSEGCSQKARKTVFNRDSKIIKHNFIINNISEILYDAKFNTLIEQFVEKLHNDDQTEDALYFAESLNIARSLPENTRVKSKEIIDHLKNNGEECFNYLFSSFVIHEDRRIQSKFIDLVFHYFQKIQNLFFDSNDYHQDSSSNCNFYANECQDVHDPKYDYLFGRMEKSNDSFKQLDQRINFMQAFKLGVIDQQHNYVWKLRDNQETSLEEINTLLDFSQTFPSNDFNERLSLTMQNMQNPAVQSFKQKLEKIKLNIC